MNCHVCGRGFPDERALALHRVTHPGRSEAELAAAAAGNSAPVVQAPAVETTPAEETSDAADPTAA